MPLPEGPARITVKATDQALNHSERDVHGVIDRSAPQLTAVAPEAGTTVTEPTLTLTGTVQDATATTVKVDGVPAFRDQSVWTAIVARAEDGSHTFTIVATDEAGNETTTGHQLTFDRAPPELTVIPPASITNASSVQITGTVTDLSLQSLKVNGTDATLEGTGISRTYSATLPLVEGENHFRTIATDVGQRMTEAHADVMRDTELPTNVTPISTAPLLTCAVLVVTLRAITGVQPGALGAMRQYDDAVREPVVIATLKDSVFEQSLERPDARVCLYMSADGSYAYTEPSADLMQRLRRRVPALRAASHPDCIGEKVLLWLGPVQWIDSKSAEVSAGEFVPTMSGRPGYLVKRNWFGRWRVVRIFPAQ